VRKIVALTPTDTGAGFGLAGIRQVVPGPDERGTLVLSLARDPTTGVVIVDERLIDATLERQLAALDREWPGLVVVLPAPALAPAAREDYALQMIRRAIGYQVRLNL
jgi:vacuolar-type H+-ATPase subunit F/Vma7